MPDAVETISYQMPTFKYEGKALVGYAAFTNHLSLFPYSNGVMSQLKEELAAYDTSGKGGTIRFTAEAPLTRGGGRGDRADPDRRDRGAAPRKG